MSTEANTDESIPDWLAAAVLDAIRSDAGKCDPRRADIYASADVERVRRAIDRSDAILAAHRRFDDDDAIDVALARAALLVARGLIRYRAKEASDG